MGTVEKDRILQLRGEDLCDNDGDKIGSIEEIYLDADSGSPEWALVNTGMFGGKSTFVPLRDASETDGALRVPYDKATVKDAPKLEPNGQLSQREESELYRYYSLDYADNGSDTALPDARRLDTDSDTEGTVGRDVSGPETDQAMTRSEEELTVGKTERESGRARLRKHVVTEEVTKTVPVKREEIRIEREPITDANAGDAHGRPGDLRRGARGRAARGGARHREARRPQGARPHGQGRRGRGQDRDRGCPARGDRGRRRRRRRSRPPLARRETSR